MRRILNYTVIAAGFAILGSLALGGGTGSTPKTVYWDATDTIYSPDLDTLTADTDTTSIEYERKFEYACLITQEFNIDTLYTIDSIYSGDVTNNEYILYDNLYLSGDDNWYTMGSGNFTGFDVTTREFEAYTFGGVRAKIDIITPDSGVVIVYRVRAVFKPM